MIVIVQNWKYDTTTLKLKFQASYHTFLSKVDLDRYWNLLSGCTVFIYDRDLVV